MTGDKIDDYSGGMLASLVSEPTLLHLENILTTVLWTIREKAGSETKSLDFNYKHFLFSFSSYAFVCVKHLKVHTVYSIICST